MEDLVGRALGPYELLDRIGTGGMATVYRGVHRALDQPRAIKVLSPALAADESLVERFQSEAKIASGLRHPNIVSIYDVGEQDGLFYLVMDLVEGESLGRLLRREKTLELARAVRLLEQLAAALDYAHGRGVIHRDVKAGNVLVDEQDHVSLFDFGVARVAAAMNRLTIPGQVVGTPEYLAPEVITGSEGDRRVDFYALGVLTYQMLAGRLPFSGADTMALLYAQVSKAPPSLCAIRPSLPVAVEHVVTRQLAKVPEARYPTADSFVSALRAAALDAPARGPSTPIPVSRPTPPPQTRPAEPRPAAPAAHDPSSQTFPGLDDEVATPLPPSRYQPVEEPITARPSPRPAGFDQGMATIPPEPVYRSAAPPTDRGEGPATIEPAQAGRVDLVLRQPATPSRVEPEPAPAGGSLLAPLVLVALAVAGIWALATGRLETIAGMVVGIEATPTVVLSVGPEPTVASIVVEVTPSSVVAAGQQGVPPVAESTVATVAPPVAAQPPAVAAGQAPASGPAETPEPTAVPVAQVAAAPPSPEQQVQAAQAQIERGEHAAALAALVALKASAPETAGLDDALYGAYLGHGQQQLERGLLDESQAAYAKALELRVDDPAALDGQKQVSLARLWRTMEEAWDRDDAVATAALEEILALDPGYRDASQKLYAILVAQANRQLEAGEVDGALVLLRRAREVYPEGEEARVLVEAHTPPPTPESEPEPAHNQAPGPASQPAPQPAPAQKPAPQQPPAPSLPKPALPSLPNPGGLPIPRP